MVVVPSSSNKPTTNLSSDRAVSEADSAAMNSVSNCNGKEDSGHSNDVPQSSYQFLLKQVESLRKENCTLKAELKNNTSHISKLETEASKMKDMVLMLGSPALASTSAEQDFCSSKQPYLPVRFHPEQSGQLMPDELSFYAIHDQNSSPAHQIMKFHNSFDSQYGSGRQRPELLLGLSNSYYHNSPLQDIVMPWKQNVFPYGSISPSPTNILPDVIRRSLASKRNERASSLKSLNLEEQTKEFYLTKLKELTSRLDSVCESEKFSKPNDEIRHQLEHEISDLKKTMEQNLGSSETMQERLETRLKHIQFLDNEIAAMEHHLRKSERNFVSLDSNSPLYGTNQAHMEDAFYAHHNSLLQNGQRFSEASTQTPKIGSPLFDHRIFDKDSSACDSVHVDTTSVAGPNQVSRSVQTVLTAKPGPGKVTLKSKYLQNSDNYGPVSSHGPTLAWPEQIGSVDSLPSQSDIDDNASTHSFTTSLPRNIQSPFSAKKDELLAPNFTPSNKEDLILFCIRMGGTIEGCQLMKQLGYMSRIVQIIHDSSILCPPTCLLTPTSPYQANLSLAMFSKTLKDVRTSMSKVLLNIVNVTSETISSRDAKIFNELQVFRRYCEHLFDFWCYSQTSFDNKNDSSSQDFPKNSTIGSQENSFRGSSLQETEKKDEKKYNFVNGLSLVFDPPVNRIVFIMKLSYEETLKRIIIEYGGLHAVAELFILHDRAVTASEMVRSSLGNDAPKPDERTFNLFRRFVGFALINLTYGDIKNKTIMIQIPGLIDTIISQMGSDSEEMQQVMAMFVRNLCWNADEKCREIFKKKNMVSVFTKCALKAKREDTLKSILSALWNLSGHCLENRENICSIKGALAFLVSTLTYRVPEIIESGGGILKNVSSLVSSNEEYRAILREKNCLQILLTHLKSGSLTIVGNACGTLWNLSARNAQDQKLLWDLGAVPMLKNLVHSKHSIIAQGSSAALRNLLSHLPESVAVESDKSDAARLKARRQKGLEHHDGIKTPEQDNFLQRRHINSAAGDAEKPMPLLMSCQRHSLQEKSTQSPVQESEVRRFQKGGLHYSGSLGNLPSSEFHDTSQQSANGTKKYMPAARNSNSYPDDYSGAATGGSMERNPPVKVRTTSFSPVGNGILKDIKMFSDQAQPVYPPNIKMRSKGIDSTVMGVSSPQGNLSLLRDFFKIIGEGKSLQSAANPMLNKSSQDGIRQVNLGGANMQSSVFSVDAKMTDPSACLLRHPDRSLLVNQASDTKKLFSQAGNSNISKLPNALVSKCPEDLLKRFFDVEEDYDNDDGPVNYSLRYGEHMTPGVQSPRTEEIYEPSEDSVNQNSRDHLDARTNYLQSQMSSTLPTAVGPSTKSDGGLSALSSCVESAGSSSAPMRQDILKGNERGQDVDNKLQLPHTGSIQTGVNFPGDGKIDPDSLNYHFEDEKPTDFSAIYSEERLYETIEHESYEMQPYVPIDEKTFQHSTNNNNSKPVVTNSSKVSKIGDKGLDENLESREEDDKFDTGAITPGHSYHYRSGRNSGNMTPRTPLEYGTPMMFSRSSSLDSVSDEGSIHSSITSGPTSRMMSGAVSPSHLPDSPSQSMPISPRRTPPPQIVSTHPADADSQRRNDSLELKVTRQPLNLEGAASHKEKEMIPKPLIAKIENKISKMNQPGYVSSVPHRDEMSTFQSEGTMSEITKFSSLTIDSNDKIRPLGCCDKNLLSPSESKVSSSGSTGDKSTHSVTKDVSSGKDERVPGQDISSLVDHTPSGPIGYVTSLPTNDEIKTFMNEGTLSPMTAFSEISFLRDDNDGFQKSTGSVFSMANSCTSKNADGAHSIASNILSFASRSSATGASVPPAPTSNQQVDKNEKAGAANEGKSKVENEVSDLKAETIENLHNSQYSDLPDEDDIDDSDSFSSCSSGDGADLLQQCINTALPKKTSRSSSRSSSKHSSRSSKSSRSKEKSDKASSQSSVASNSSPPKKIEERAETNPSPVIPGKEAKKRINIKQRIESANMKLNGVSIVEYIDKLMIQSDDEDGEVETLQASGKALKLDNSKSKQVIGDAETLNKSYSVRKKLKEDKKAQKILQENQVHDATISKPQILLNESAPAPSMQSKLRVQSYLKEGFTTYATEGTPIEMSRCTSLSNITIDSDSGDIDFNTQNSKLKTSHSEPDILLSASKLPTSDLSISAARQIQPVDIDARPQKASAELEEIDPSAKDSQEILENLGKQIESLSLAATDGLVNSNDPGYTTSTPQVDEIRRYNVEGSQFGGTEFSALTIDSETKISPAVVAETTVESSIVAPSKEVETSNYRGMSKPSIRDESVLIRAENGLTPLNVNTGISKEVKVDRPAWGDSRPLHPASHYNNDNDTLAMKEERHNYMIEDTPLNLSGGSLSSLDFGSDDDNDLLNQCISSALPPERKISNPPYPAELVLAAQNDPDATRLYSHGFPDGKLDSPLSSHEPVNFANVQAPVITGYSPEYHSPTREQFLLFQKEANALSADIMHGHHQGSDIVLNHSYHHDYHQSSSFSLTKPSGDFYHLSRQASVPDSDLSISSSILGERQTLVTGQAGSPRHNPPLTSSRNHDVQRNPPNKPFTRPKVAAEKIGKPVKRHGAGKMRDNDPVIRRGRNQPVHARDSSSGSSPSYRKQQQRHRHLSSNSRSTDVCNCQVSCAGPTTHSRRYNRGPVSASTSHLVDGIKPSSRPRRKSTNSASKNSLRACDHSSCHHHHPQKTSRTRNSAKNIYKPSVIQLYPPLKDMNGVLEGVASVAARGDKVVADRNPHYSAGNISKKSSNSSLVRSATFINENPSEILLENMTKEEKVQYAATGSVSSLSHSQSQRSAGVPGISRTTSPRQSSHSLEQSSRLSTPRGSTHSLKSQSTYSTTSKNAVKSKGTKKNTNSTKSKPKKVWSGIKKLLSPSEEAIGKIKDSGKAKPVQAKLKKKETSSSQLSSVKIQKQDQNRAISKSTTIKSGTKAAPKPAECSASSLSLTSSSASNDSSDEDAPMRDECMKSTITPYGLLPKSPSVNALMRRNIIDIPQSRSMGLISQPSLGAGSSVWRRTPPKLSQPDARSNPCHVPDQACKSESDVLQSNVSEAQNTSDEVWVSSQLATVNLPSQQSSEMTNKPAVSPQKPVEAVQRQSSCPPANSFQSPSRTQLPRVVQQVAPFNYRPAQKKSQGEETTLGSKSLSESRRVNPDCKQTPV